MNSIRWVSLVALLLVAALMASSAAARGRAPALGEIASSELPAEGRRTLALIAARGPFPFDRDGVVFGNRERILPDRPRGFYHEYTVRTPGARNRGARRIVCGGEPGSTRDCYYSDDHYQTFRRIR
jgi:ribonuclease T1